VGELVQRLGTGGVGLAEILDSLAEAVTIRNPQYHIVTGRGVEAAAMTSLVRHGARLLSTRERSPSRILASLDEALREQSGLSLCTALCVRLEGDRFVMGSAGHPPPLVVRDDGRVREIGGSGPLLGGWEGSAWEERTVSVQEGETLLMYTDGVTDTRGDDERFGSARLRRVLAEHAGEGPRELLAALEAALDRFQTEGHSDDTGAVALRPALAGAHTARAGEHASVGAGESLSG